MLLINTRWAWSLAARVGQPLCSVSLQLAWPGSQARRRPPTRRGWRSSRARISGEKSFKDREKGRPLFYLQCNPHIGVEERPRTSIPVSQLASLRPLGPWEMCLPHIERARIQLKLFLFPHLIHKIYRKFHPELVLDVLHWYYSCDHGE